MSLRKPIIVNKYELYKRAWFLSNVFMILGATLAVLYLFNPLFGGKFSAHSVIAYASWVAIGLGLKPVLKRQLKGLRVRAYEYLIACSCAIFSLFVWWRYPVNIILSILTVACFFFAYRTQDKA